MVPIEAKLTVDFLPIIRIRIPASLPFHPKRIVVVGGEELRAVKRAIAIHITKPQTRVAQVIRNHVFVAPSAAIGDSPAFGVVNGLNTSVEVFNTRNIVGLVQVNKSGVCTMLERLKQLSRLPEHDKACILYALDGLLLNHYLNS